MPKGSDFAYLYQESSDIVYGSPVPQINIVPTRVGSPVLQNKFLPVKYDWLTP